MCVLARSYQDGAVVVVKGWRAPHNRHRSECGVKVPHRTKEGARIHKEQLDDKKGVPEMHAVYECRWCGFWHVGRVGARSPVFARGKAALSKMKEAE
jgi:hypothetical protein